MLGRVLTWALRRENHRGAHGRDYFLGGFGCGWPGLLCPPPGCQGFGCSLGLSAMRSPPLGEFATTQIMKGARLRQQFSQGPPALPEWRRRNLSPWRDVPSARNFDLSRVSGDA